VYLIDLAGDGISINGRNLLAFDSALSWDIKRTQGAGMLSGGLFNTVISGTGTVALCTVGQPVVLDCSVQPTYVDVQSAVGWSASLVPQLVSSVNVRSMLRGGSGEAFQYAFHGPGFVVVQPSEWVAATEQESKSGPGGIIGEFLS
ncbi:MAG: AIM24 family protein, partial [Angustibacter sp.]